MNLVEVDQTLRKLRLSGMADVLEAVRQVLQRCGPAEHVERCATGNGKAGVRRRDRRRPPTRVGGPAIRL